jgi:hypothetical protein
VAAVPLDSNALVGEKDDPWAVVRGDRASRAVYPGGMLCSNEKTSSGSYVLLTRRSRSKLSP